jgi:hypothetical protein
MAIYRRHDLTFTIEFLVTFTRHIHRRFRSSLNRPQEVEDCSRQHGPYFGGVRNLIVNVLSRVRSPSHSVMVI